MKYIVFQQGNLLIPVILPDCAVHSMVKMEEAKVRSAGHFHIDEGSIILSTNKSISLGIGPRKFGENNDAELLTKLWNNEGSASFILHPGDDGYIEPPDE